MFVVGRDLQHRFLGRFVAHLICEGARFPCALQPVLGVVEQAIFQKRWPWQTAWGSDGFRPMSGTRLTSARYVIGADREEEMWLAPLAVSSSANR